MPRQKKLIPLVCCALGLLWAGSRGAVSQAGAKQTLVVGYPTQGILIGGPTKYTGLIYVRVFPSDVDPQRAKPIATAELGPSQRDVMQLPTGTYEVHFQMRTGSELKTFIMKDVILRADRAASLVVEMNDGAKTTVIGGDMTAQQMADSIRQLQAELAATRREITELKRK